MKKLFIWVAAVALCVSCSQEETVAPPSGGDSGLIADGEARYLTVNIMSANESTRAEDGQAGMPTDKNALYEEGYAEENKVNNVRFYFFDAKGNAASVKANGDSYLDWTPDEKDNKGPDMPNVEKKLAAHLVISTKIGDRLPAKIAAVINANEIQINDNDKWLETNLSLDELRKKTKDFTTDLTTKGFVMANSVYADNNEVIAATTIESKHYKKSEDNLEENPVEIYVERAVAKVRVKLGDNQEIIKTSENTYIPIYDKVDGDKAQIKIKPTATDTEDTEEKPVYLKLGKWNLTAETDRGNLSKDIDPSWTKEALGFQPNVRDYFRSFWATNATGANQTWSKNWNDINSDGFSFGSTDNENVAYTNENAPYAETGTLIDKYTKVVLTGELVCKTGGGQTDDDFKPVEITKFYGVTYIGKDALKTALMAYLNGGLIYSWSYNKNEDGKGDPTESVEDAKSIVFSDITKDDVDLKTIEDITPNSEDVEKEGAGRYLVYLQLSVDGKKKNWSQTNVQPEDIKNWESSGKIMNTDGANEYLKGLVTNAQIYDAGKTYYYFPIQHLRTSLPTEDAKPEETLGYYGVVRNHIYDCSINTIAGFGTPVYDPTEVIYPEKPSDDFIYIAAKINILSWRVVTNSVDLNWGKN